MQLTFTRRSLIWGAVTILGVVALAMILLAGPATPADTTNQAPSANDVATQATRTFYTVDYRQQEAWLNSLRSWTTPQGMAFIETGYARSLWPALSAAQTVVAADQVTATDGAVLKSAPSGDWQIIRVDVVMTALWPGMTSGTFSVNALVRQRDGAWGFESFLSDADVATFGAAPSIR